MNLGTGGSLETAHYPYTQPLERDTLQIAGVAGTQNLTALFHELQCAPLDGCPAPEVQHERRHGCHGQEHAH